MKFLSLSAALLCVLAVTGCGGRNISTSEQKYVGAWFSQGEEQSFSWRLADDGTFGEGKGFTTPAPDDGEWRVEGDTLVLTRTKDGKEVEERYKISANATQLTVDQGGKFMVFTRTN